jgi:hypothetical protein
MRIIRSLSIEWWLKGAMTVKWPASIDQPSKWKGAHRIRFLEGVSQTKMSGDVRGQRIPHKRRMIWCWKESGWRYHAEQTSSKMVCNKRQITRNTKRNCKPISDQTLKLIYGVWWPRIKENYPEKSQILRHQVSHPLKLRGHQYCCQCICGKRPKRYLLSQFFSVESKVRWVYRPLCQNFLAVSMTLGNAKKWDCFQIQSHSLADCQARLCRFTVPARPAMGEVVGWGVTSPLPCAPELLEGPCPRGHRRISYSNVRNSG